MASLDIIQQKVNLERVSRLISFDDASPIASIEAAEDRILFNLTDAKNDTLALKDQIAREIILISGRTRVGKGNVILMHSQMAKRMGITIPEKPTKIGRWAVIEEPVFKDAKVFVSDHLPENEVFVTLRQNDSDAPGIVFHRNDEYRLYVLEALPDVMGDATDYISRIRFDIRD